MALTKRQEWLYGFLKEANERDPGRWVTLREIVDAMNCDLTYSEGDNYSINPNPKAHNPCPSLWEDKEAINADPTVDEPIMYNNYNLKIPSSIEELKEFYVDDLYKRARKMMWRYGVAMRKAKKDGQMQIEFGEDGKMTERFIRSIIRKACSDMAEELDEEEKEDAANVQN